MREKQGWERARGTRYRHSPWSYTCVQLRYMIDACVHEVHTHREPTGYRCTHAARQNEREFVRTRNVPQHTSPTAQRRTVIFTSGSTWWFSHDRAGDAEFATCA